MDLATVEADIATAASSVEHAAAWLLGMAQLARKDVQTLEAASPLVKDAIVAGEAAAAAHGVPVAAIVTGAGQVLDLAQQIETASAPKPAAAS
jgi:hypothetical protein